MAGHQVQAAVVGNRVGSQGFKNIGLRCWALEFKSLHLILHRGFGLVLTFKLARCGHTGNEGMGKGVGNEVAALLVSPGEGGFRVGGLEFHLSFCWMICFGL